MGGKGRSRDSRIAVGGADDVDGSKEVNCMVRNVELLNAKEKDSSD
jgi:hypothetical protein